MNFKFVKVIMAFEEPKNIEISKNDK